MFWSRKRFLKNATESHLYKNEDRSSPLHQNQKSSVDRCSETAPPIDDAVIFTEKHCRQDQEEDVSRTLDHDKSQTRLEARSGSRLEYQTQDSTSHFKHAASVLNDASSEQHESVNSNDSRTCGLVEVMDHCSDDNMYNYCLLYCKSCMKYFVKHLDFRKHMKFCSVNRTCGKCFVVFKTRLQLFSHIAQKKHNVKLLDMWIDVSFSKLQKLKAAGKVWFDSVKDIHRIRIKKKGLLGDKPITEDRKAVFSGALSDDSQKSYTKGNISYPELTGYSFGECYNPSTLGNTETSGEPLNSVGISDIEQSRVSDKLSAPAFKSLKGKQESFAGKLDRQQGLLESETCAAKPNSTSRSSSSRNLHEEPEIVQTDSDEKNCLIMRGTLNENCITVDKESNGNTNDLAGETETGRRKNSCDEKYFQRCVILCKKCKTYFIYRESFCQHRVYCKQKRNACIRCGHIFSSTHQLQQHIVSARHAVSSQSEIFLSQQKLEYLITKGRVYKDDMEKDKVLSSQKKEKGYLKSEKESLISKPITVKTETKKSNPADKINLAEPIDLRDMIVVDQYVNPSLLRSQSTSENPLGCPSRENHEVKDCQTVKSNSEDGTCVKLVNIKMKSGCSGREASSMHESYRGIFQENHATNSVTVPEKHTTTKLALVKDASSQFVQEKDSENESAQENNTIGKSLQVKDMALVEDNVKNRSLLKEDVNRTVLKVKDATSISVQEKSVISKLHQRKDTINNCVNEKNVPSKVLHVQATFKLAQEKDLNNKSLQGKDVVSKLVQVGDASRKLSQERNICSKSLQESSVTNILVQEKGACNTSKEKVVPGKLLQENDDAITSGKGKDVTCKSVHEKDTSLELVQKKVNTGKSGTETDSFCNSEQGKAFTITSGKKRYITGKSQEEGDYTNRSEQEIADTTKVVHGKVSTSKIGQEKDVTSKSVQGKGMDKKLIKERDSIITVSSLKRKRLDEESPESSASVLSEVECNEKIQLSMISESKQKLKTMMERKSTKEVKKGKDCPRRLHDIQNSGNCQEEPVSQFSRDRKCLVDDLCYKFNSKNITGAHGENLIIFKAANDIPVKAVEETEVCGSLDKGTLLTETIKKREHRMTALKREASFERPMPKSKKIARNLVSNRLTHQKELKHPPPIKRRSVRLEKLTEECPGCLEAIDVETVIFNTLSYELSFWCKICAWDIIFLNFGQPSSL